MAASGGWNPATDPDANALFSSHTVEEIRQIEQKTRRNVEEKKEELRQLVGERYRDLISAADTIVEIKNTCEEVSGLVGDIKGQSLSLQQTHRLRGFAVGVRPPESPALQLFSLAAQAKLLVDLPSKLWSCLEGKQCLKAAQYHLLAQHIAHTLHLEGGRSEGSKILTLFPVLSNHWNSLSTIQASILRACRNILKDINMGQQVQVECLCAILLLEGSSPRQVFNEFLMARKAAVQSILHSHFTVSAKSQVVELAKCLRSSFALISSIFCQTGEDPSLLLSTLQGIVDPKRAGNTDTQPLLGDFLSRTHFKYLPQNIQEFKPAFSMALNEVPKRTIHSLCEEWMNDISTDVREGTRQLMLHVGSAKGIAAIRSAVYTQLSEPIQSESNCQMEWDQICSHVIGRPISIWREFLEEEVVKERSKAIVKGYFEIIERQALETLDALVLAETPLKAEDVNFLSYMWGEEEGGGPMRLSASGPASESGASQEETAAQSAKAHTPAVLSFCHKLALQLSETVICDLGHLLQQPEEKAGPARGKTVVQQCSLLANEPRAPVAQQDVFPFNLYSRDAETRQFLASAAQGFVDRLLVKVDESVERLKGLLTAQNREGVKQTTSQTVDRILMFGRLCRGLTDCCPSLHELLSGLDNDGDGVHVGIRFRPRLFSAKEKEKTSNRSAVQTHVNDMLLQRYTETHRIWCQWSKDVIVAQLRGFLFAGSSSIHLASPLAWEDITIKEESEAGTTVESTIQIPTQVSSYVGWLLFTQCREIARVGGHTLPSTLLDYLRASLFEGCMEVYAELLEEMQGTDNADPLQNCALQLWFDVRYLSSLLTSLELPADKAGVAAQVLSKLEALIDPFDFNVFHPYLMHYLERQKQRANILWGAVAGTAASMSLATTKSKLAGVPQDRHLVIPLGPPVGRFTLLPIGGGTGNRRLGQPDDKPQLFGTESASLSDLLWLYQEALS